MLETIAKGRLETGRPPAGQTKTGKPPANDPTAPLENELQRERLAQIRDQIMLEQQREAYDFATAEHAEIDREYNNTRDLMLAQMKADDEVVKKFIAMI
jgi:hypothetical protein